MIDVCQLTDRELMVLEQLTTGSSRREIAKSLDISCWTVNSHIKAIYAKLGATCRTEATVIAFRRGLVRFSDRERGRS